MFDSTFRTRTAARTAATLHAALDDWRAGDGGWFDNSIGSVDARIAKADKLIHALRAAGPNSFNQSIIAQLSGERDDLVGFRQSMLNAHQDRVAAHVGRENDRSEYRIAARDFVRNNIEAAQYPEEMRERAYRHAELYSFVYPGNFADDCVKVAAALPKPKTAAAQPTHVADFPDNLLFS